MRRVKSRHPEEKRPRGREGADRKSRAVGPLDVAPRSLVNSCAVSGEDRSLVGVTKSKEGEGEELHMETLLSD